jgi:anti-sigma B factor antagonist
MSQVAIPARSTAGAVARRAVAKWIAGHPRVDDALLAVTELVNNAVVHSGLAPGSSLTVTVEPDGDALRLTVAHDGIKFEAPDSPRLSSEPRASRGLAIVDKIADSWGVESNGGEVSAWFEVRPRRRDARSREGSSVMGLGPQLVLETTRIGDSDVIVVSGEIDLASAPRVELALEPFSGQAVVLDLRRVEFIDSAGLKVLLSQRSRIERSGGDLKLVVGHGAVGRLLELTGVTEAFSISDSIEVED